MNPVLINFDRRSMDGRVVKAAETPLFLMKGRRCLRSAHASVEGSTPSPCKLRFTLPFCWRSHEAPRIARKGRKSKTLVCFTPAEIRSRHSPATPLTTQHQAERGGPPNCSQRVVVAAEGNHSTCSSSSTRAGRIAVDNPYSYLTPQLCTTYSASSHN